MRFAKKTTGCLNYRRGKFSGRSHSEIHQIWSENFLVTFKCQELAEIISAGGDELVGGGGGGGEGEQFGSHPNLLVVAFSPWPYRQSVNPVSALIPISFNWVVQQGPGSTCLHSAMSLMSLRPPIQLQRGPSRAQTHHARWKRDQEIMLGSTCKNFSPFLWIAKWRHGRRRQLHFRGSMTSVQSSCQ